MGELNAVSERGKVFGREGNLLGLFSEPRQGPEMPVAVVLLNAGIIHRVGASRFTVQLARTLAEAGYRTFRFDLSGIGDSALPRREAPLTDIVKQDIDDAITLTLEDGRCPGGVVLIGLCSGADNAFHVAPSDSRIRGLVLIDPMVHETPGFRREKMKQRLTSARSWLNVVSGRSIALRLKDRLGSEDGALPPDHYGLLTDPPEAMQEKAKQLEADGVRLLYVLTGGAHRYCNYPGQVADSLRLSPRSPVLQVEWRPQANHILSDRTDRQWLYRTVLQWLPDVEISSSQPHPHVGR